MSSYIGKVLLSSIGILISRIFGLIRDISIAAYFGATALTDIFFVAFAIPNLFRQFFVEGAISSAFMPFLTEKFKVGGHKMQNAYLTQLIVVQTFIISIITLIIIFLADYVILLFVPGFSENKEILNEGANLLRIVMPFLLLISFSGLLSGFLNFNNSYFIPYVSSALFNMAMILGAWVGYKESGNIYYLAYGTLLGGFLQALLIFSISLIYGYKPIFFKTIDKAIKQTYLLIIPSIAGVSISQLNFLIGRVLASYLAVGSISWLFYSNRIFQFPLGVLAVAVGTVSLTELSKAYINNDVEKRVSLIDKSILTLFIAIIPATIGLYLLSTDITRLIFYRNNFTETDLVNTASALRMYSVGLIFFSFINLFTKVFHSKKDTKTPVKAAFIGFVLNVILNLILMQFLAHSGIALASSISAFFNALFLYVFIKDYSLNINRHKVLLIKVISSNILLIILIMILKHIELNVLLIILFSILFYFGYLYSLRVNVLKVLR